MEKFKIALQNLTTDNNKEIIKQQTKLLLAQNQALADCDAMSVISAIINLDNIGLDLSNTKGEAYLIPYKSTAQLQISYKGFEKLAYQSGQVQFIDTTIVYKSDELVKEDGMIFVKKDMDKIFETKKREDIKGFIATIKFIDGTIYQEFANVKDMWEFATEYSSAHNYKKENSIWTKQFEKMSLKTLVKRLLRKNGVGSKLNSPHLATALQVDQSAFIDSNKIKYVDNGDKEAYIRLPNETKQQYWDRTKKMYLEKEGLIEQEDYEIKKNKVDKLIEETRRLKEEREEREKNE